MTRVPVALLTAVLACAGASVHGQEPPVVVVTTTAGEVAGGPWAMSVNGLLRMAAGSLDDAPSLAGFTGLSVVHANWEFTGLVLAKADVLRSERAERRQVPTFSRRIDARRSRIVAEDLADPTRLARLVRGLGASADLPAYAFVAVALRGSSRTGVESGPSSRGSLLSDSAPTSRFEQRFYVFRVVAPEQ